MSESMYRNQLERLVKEKAALEDKRAAAVSEAARHRDSASRTRTSITKSTSASMARMKERQALASDKKEADALRKASGVEKDIGRKVQAINSAQRNLDRAQEASRQKREREERKRREAEKRHAKELERDTKRQADADRRRRRDELDHEHRLTQEARSRDRLFSPRVTVEFVERLPERITVLVVAANPQDTARLRLDEEVREITERLQASRYRDSVDLRSVWAVRPLDLLQALNEHRPRVVHFSGHGGPDGDLMFQDADGNAKPVTPDAIATTVATAADDVQLAVFNACFSAEQAEAVVSHIPVAIGMGRPIGDTAARVFAGAFYNAIGFGFSVQRSFEKGVAALKLEGIHEDDTPELVCAEGVDPDAVVLVQPQRKAA